MKRSNWQAHIIRNTPFYVKLRSSFEAIDKSGTIWMIRALAHPQKVSSLSDLHVGQSCRSNRPGVPNSAECGHPYSACRTMQIGTTNARTNAEVRLSVSSVTSSRRLWVGGSKEPTLVVFTDLSLTPKALSLKGQLDADRLSV